MVHKGIRAVLTGQSTVSDFDLSSERLCALGLYGAVYINFFCLHPSLYLLMS